ncbi:hypothetical protein BBD41_14945 [Paenibacillus ihbetae]|uniref:Uncharacterized protein n=1 Tax=Paenibacillus ihbetae TaxID=1870820 RepID=A0A1B2E1A8_9BACL|nr:hypothetical protein BBD41_14945 [Paenibacillus ihbetae]OOC64047.1 hypothetical protein BBD40_20585 [Paenibacillus ihbetae]
MIGVFHLMVQRNDMNLPTHLISSLVLPVNRDTILAQDITVYLMEEFPKSFSITGNLKTMNVKK